ncbi:MAG TPA: right-handed parallel beta-helix repeat-containing protein, partial [Chloroflexota bacterium]|nr:right-handed parallel beta-helix repeat-containing protein [Chloroflexota bacterium]
PPAANRVTCGQTITKNTTLFADVGPCAGNGIIIGADNITLNLNGHTISGSTGPADGNAAGVRLPNRTGVTVTGLPGASGKKGTITGFDVGVFINRGSGNTIENLDIIDNTGPADPAAEPLPLLGDGVAVFYSTNNQILNNLVARNGYYDGITVLGLGSHNNLIRGNTVEDTLGIDDRYFPSFQGTGIVISHFLNADDPRGLPIFNNDVVNNVVRRNFTAGVSTVANHKGRIIGNTIEDNGDVDRYLSQRNGNGIGITTGDVVFFPSIADTRMLVERNQVNRNALMGILVDRGAAKNTIVRNVANENFLDGIFMGVAPNNLIAQNTSLNTVLLEDLFDSSFFEGDENCQGNIWRDNIYGTAAPDCATHGTQVDPSQYVAPQSSQPRANPRALEHTDLPPRPKAPRN